MGSSFLCEHHVNDATEVRDTGAELNWYFIGCRSPVRSNEEVGVEVISSQVVMASKEYFCEYVFFEPVEFSRQVMGGEPWAGAEVQAFAE